jgi:IS30 family transposase
MNNKYNHLDDTKRKLIAHKLNIEDKSIRAIAAEICVDPSTVSREIDRNKVKASKWTLAYKQVNGSPVKIIDKLYIYDPKYADMLADKRAKIVRCQHKIIYGSELLEAIDKQLKDGWKPDTIAGRLKYQYPDNPAWHISHEAIYQYAYAHTECGWWEYLKKGNKKRKKQSKRKGVIKNRVSISQRPEEVEERKEIGHLEGDSVVGCRGESKKIINTLVDRCSRKMFADFAPDKTAENTKIAIIGSLRDIKDIINSLTLDNGTEFALHEQIAKALGIDVYFAHPYSSWERGTNERHNGLLRRYFPKKKDFEDISDEELAEVVDFWNNYPRKILGYRTPNEVWDEQANELKLAA